MRWWAGRRAGAGSERAMPPRSAQQAAAMPVSARLPVAAPRAWGVRGAEGPAGATVNPPAGTAFDRDDRTASGARRG